MRTSREIFKASGEPEKAERVAEMDELGRREAESVKKNPELEKILSKVDFDLLKSILQRVAARSNINPDTLNFLGPARIAHQAHDWAAAGTYHPGKNTIGLSYERIQNRAEDFNLDINFVTLALLFHEEVHATSKVKCLGLESQLGQYPFKKRMQIGYRQHIVEIKSPEDLYKPALLYDLFNEGVTEKLSREVFSEYVRRIGRFDKKDIQRYENAWYERPEEMSYEIPMELVETFINKISDAAGIGRKTVWHALIRGMYEGEEFQDQELRTLFSELIAPDFLNRLAQANTARLRKLILELREEKISKPEKIKLRGWFKRTLAKFELRAIG